MVNHIFKITWKTFVVKTQIAGPTPMTPDGSANCGAWMSISSKFPGAAASAAVTAPESTLENHWDGD